MKIRNGFVSNSSSSSFILAVKSDISKNEKRVLFNKYIKKEYEEAAKEWSGDEVVPSEEKVIQGIFESHSSNYLGSGILLDSWLVRGGECGSEDSSFISYLLYCMPEVDTPKFKFKAVS